jgi:hypothetical protein
MSRSLRVGLVFALASAAAFLAFPVQAWSSTTASITSIRVTGSAAHPVITIRGHHFGSRPAPRPKCRPGDFNKCGHYTGHDYGSMLYFVEKSKTRFSAGRDRPSRGELDAIGLVVTTYTSTKIVYHFGSGYHDGHGAYGWRLKNGDAFTASVKGAHITGTVHY